MYASLASLVVSVGFLVAPDANDRPFTEARVNDYPIRLAIDTGSEVLALFSYAADRIGLPYRKPQQPPPASQLKPGGTMVYPSDLCRLKLGKTEVQTRLAICEIPPGLRMPGSDGVIGWRVLSNNILYIDWGQKTLEPVLQVPRPATQWQAFDLYSPPGISVLALQVSESSDAPKAVYIDTGDPSGVAVCPALWQEILSQHPGLPTTIEGSYSPGVGYHVSSVCWLRVLRLGDIELHDVPVSEASEAVEQWPAYFARIGLYGLTRLELIVDGKQNRAYVHPKEDYAREYDYNRAGVVFLPTDNHSSDLLATVMDGGPAQEAGIRTGDRLLRVDGRDITGWQTDPNGWMSDRTTFARPAGTKVTLTIVRDAHPLEVTVVLKEILPIEAPSRTTKPVN